MPPPPPWPPASTAAASRAAMLHEVNTLASYSDALADFLDQWNSVVLDVASIAATFAVLFPVPRPNPSKPYLPAAEPQLAPAPEPEPTLAPQPDREPEPTLEPQPEPGLNAAPAPEPQWEREPSPLPEPQFTPLPEPQPSPLPEPAPQPSPAPEPAPAPHPQSAPNPDRERKGGGSDAFAAELEHRCKQMNCWGLRRFVTARVREGGGSEWLRRVGPGALRRAPDPAELVLRAVGRYYIRAESPDAEAACTLLLELYVRAGCPRLRGAQGRGAELLLRQEAREAALTWRCRLLSVSDVGGVGDAPGAAGACGLAFFMAAFGVPDEFPAQELCDLVDAADVEVLKASKLFVKMMRDVVIEMINEAMYLLAMRVILAFEFQEAFPLAPTLALIIEKLEHNVKDENDGQASERDEENLALLNSISKCMEDHKLSPSEFTSFAAKIALLEERVGKPKQTCTGVKRKRAEECAE